jgi:hypothetical protein
VTAPITAERLAEIEAREHDLKTWPEYFAAVLDGRKTFEVRRTDDRHFAVGDVLRLREWDPACGAYTGRATTQRVSYIVQGPPFLPAGLAVLGLDLTAALEIARREGAEAMRERAALALRNWVLAGRSGKHASTDTMEAVAVLAALPLDAPGGES